MSGQGVNDEHLTAMRYSDWALGRFFDQVRNEPWYKDTLFVVIGDHGFGTPRQLTDLDLLRFNVPMLLIAPGITERFGQRNDIVGTQVDVVPTIMGRLGGAVQQQCWGRDLLALPAGDKGFGVIKPSGGGQTVGLLRGDELVVQPRGEQPRAYRYQLGPQATVTEQAHVPGDLQEQLKAYVQTATSALLEDRVGVEVAAGKEG